MTKEELGKIVRKQWVEWATELQSHGIPVKLSWLTPWEKLDKDQREVDMQIGVAVALAVRKRIRQLVQERIDLLDPNDFTEASMTLADILLVLELDPVEGSVT